MNESSDLLQLLQSLSLDGFFSQPSSSSQGNDADGLSLCVGDVIGFVGEPERLESAQSA